jgi:uncharacterized protein YlxW (UPF0749 family)
MAEEDLIREEDVLEEEDLNALDQRVRREIEEDLRLEEEEPEVVELPPNVDRVQVKQAQLQQEINVCQAQINELANKMETAQLAFQQCVILLQVQEQTDGS